MTVLPSHGRVNCTRCFANYTCPSFDKTRLTADTRDWRITSNPLAWGSSEPEVIVLGFSKGPTQAGALANTPHDEIAYKGSRENVGKILAHIGLIEHQPKGHYRPVIDRLISERNGRFHFASLIRCTVERLDAKSMTWKGSGGGMLDKFVATPFGEAISSNCIRQHLEDLPDRTRLVVMFGLGSRLNYVAQAMKIIVRARGGDWKMVNEVTYTDGKVTFVHVEHFASQGALLPNWLGERDDPRSEYGRQAQEGVRYALKL